jgi:hypothetical protein
VAKGCYFSRFEAVIKKIRGVQMATAGFRSATRMDENSTQDLQAIRVHQIDYEEFARRSGEEAYQNALDAGLSEEAATRFKEVFGTPIEPEFRP